MDFYKEYRKDFTLEFKIELNQSAYSISNYYFDASSFCRIYKFGKWFSKLEVDQMNISEHMTNYFKIDFKEVEKWNEFLSKQKEQDFEINIHVTHLRRNYANSEDIQFEIVKSWFDLYFSFNLNGKLIKLTDGTDSIYKILDMIKKNFSFYYTNYILDYPKINEDLDLNQSANLLLPPTPASILIHEMIGHFLESNSSYNLDRIGIKELNVKNLCTRFYDDEGIKVRNNFFIKQGYIANKIYERKNNVNKPSGLVKAAPHSGLGLIRCTELMTLSGGVEVGDFYNFDREIIKCIKLSGAEYTNGFGIFHVEHAVKYIKGKPEKSIYPFYFYIPITQLLNRISGIGNDVMLANSARCTKNGISIPTINYSPSILLNQVTLLRR
ncbi:hypothetical protein ACE41D_27235 [Bacillus albus]|uniref:hypothetical protein n=1 Tax=Bacillus albus TaxID=2026189 RepID=UPI0035C9439F